MPYRIHDINNSKYNYIHNLQSIDLQSPSQCRSGDHLEDFMYYYYASRCCMHFPHPVRYYYIRLLVGFVFVALDIGRLTVVACL